MDIVPAIVRTAPLTDAELADRLERGLPEPRVVGQAEVVVRRERDRAARPSTETIGPWADDMTRSGR